MALPKSHGIALGWPMAPGQGVRAAPALTLQGTLAFQVGAATGTMVAAIGGVPAGITPTITPGDGRLVIGGSEGAGWKVVVGSTAASVGTIAFTVAAIGAASASATVTVSAAGVALPRQGAIVLDLDPASLVGLGDGAAIASWASGVGSDVATQADAGKRPKIYTTGLGGQPYVDFDGTSTLALPVDGAMKTALASGTFTLLMVFQQVTGTSYGCAFTCDDGNAYEGFTILADGSLVGGKKGAGTALPVGSLPFYFGGMVSGNADEFGQARGCCNGTATRSYGTAGSVNGVPTIGGSLQFGGAINARFRLSRIIGWNAALTEGEQVQFSRWAHDKHARPYPWAGNGRFWAFEGNSIWTGLNGTYEAIGSFPARVAARNGWPLGSYTFSGYSGKSMNDIVAQAPRRVDPLVAALGSTPLYWAVSEYANSYSANAADMGAINATKSAIAGRRTAGVTKIVLGMPTDISTAEGSGYNPAHRTAYIAYDWQGAGGADAVIRIDLAPNIGTGTAPASPPNAYYSDTKHLTDLGYDAMADYGAPVLQGIA